MQSVMNTIGTFYSALGQRDAKVLRAVLADDFSFQGPMMKFDNPDAFVNMMITFPFKVTASNSRFIVDGNHVAHTFLWEATAPSKASIPMCEVLTVEDEKIQHSELFFDTKLFPDFTK